jgi:hypothetical protein
MRASQELKEERMDAKIAAIQEKMEARIDANNEKFDVLRGTLVSLMDIHQARTLSNQEDMEAKMDIYQEKIEAAIHFIRSELEETIKHSAEDVLLCVDQKTQGLCKELAEKIEDTQVDLQAVKVSLNTQMKSLQETVADKRPSRRAWPHVAGQDTGTEG